MNQIWKFELAVKVEQEVELPKLFHPTQLAFQGKALRLWGMVAIPEATEGDPLPVPETENRKVHMRGTGHNLDMPLSSYIGTVEDPDSLTIDGTKCIWHFFLEERSEG